MECNGKRKIEQFVKVKEFSYKNLVDDMSFLENSARKVACMKGPIKSTSRGGSGTVSLGCSKDVLNKLRKAASMRRINLKLSPFITTRRRLNTTYCNSRSAEGVHRSTKMCWHVCWVFDKHEYEEATVDETIPLADLLQRIVYCDNDFIKHLDEEKVGKLAILRSKIKESNPENGQEFIQTLAVGLEAEHLNKPKTISLMDMSLPLSKNLSGKTVVEYPILHIIPKSKLSDYTQL